MSICMSCGTTHDCRGHNRLVAERDRLREDKRELLAALEEIAEGAGPYSMDPLQHASNTIEAMKELARAALAKAQEAVR